MKSVLVRPAVQHMHYHILDADKSFIAVFYESVEVVFVFEHELPRFLDKRLYVRYGFSVYAPYCVSQFFFSHMQFLSRLAIDAYPFRRIPSYGCEPNVFELFCELLDGGET